MYEVQLKKVPQMSLLNHIFLARNTLKLPLPRNQTVLTTTILKIQHIEKQVVAHN